MIEFDLGIAEQLTQVTTTSSVQVRVGTSNSDLVIASIIQPLMQNFGMGRIHHSFTNCSKRHRDDEYNWSRCFSNPLHRLCIIRYSGRDSKSYSNIGYIDSPIMLESMMLRTLHRLENSQIQQNFVILDSVNALSIYNEERILAEYLHTFINTCKNRQVLSLIVNVPDQTPAGVLSNLDLYCSDLMIVVR